MVEKMVSSATGTVAHCFGGYMLPPELEGEVVRLREFDHGFYAVQCSDGRRFHIASSQCRLSFSPIIGPGRF